MDVRMAWLTTCIPPKASFIHVIKTHPLIPIDRLYRDTGFVPNILSCEKGLKVVKHQHLNLINLLGSEGDF
jgi:hypothetical protein